MTLRNILSCSELGALNMFLSYISTNKRTSFEKASLVKLLFSARIEYCIYSKNADVSQTVANIERKLQCLKSDLCRVMQLNGQLACHLSGLRDESQRYCDNYISLAAI